MGSLENQTPRKRISILGWLVILGLFVWNAISFWPQSQPSVELPYAEFVKQASDNNVTSVMISGSNTYHQQSDGRRSLRFEFLEYFSKG
jgi:hypothetical protein